MPNRPIEIATELLRYDPEPQVRRNAVTALGVLGTPDAAESIVATAIEDGDPGVRDHAAAEVLRLSQGDRDAAHAALLTRLSDHQRGVGAYRLLGRLRNEGGFAVRVPASFSQRVKLEFKLNQALNPGTWWKPRPHSMGAALAGTLASLAVIAAVVVSALDIGEAGQAMSQWVTYSALLALVLGGAATLRTTPIYLHPSYAAGTLVEAVWASMLTVAGAVLPVLLILSDEPGALLPLLGQIALFGAAVRAGAAAGAATRFHEQYARSVWAAAAGGCAGLLVLGVFVALRGTLGGGSGSMILALVPVGFGLAYASGRVDERARKAGPAGGVLARSFAAALILAGLAGALGFTFLRSTPFGGMDFVSDTTITAQGTGNAIVPLDSTPVRVAVRASRGQVLSAEATDRINEDVLVALFDEPAAVRLAMGDDPAEVKEFQVPDDGIYYIVVSNFLAKHSNPAFTPDLSVDYIELVDFIANRLSLGPASWATVYSSVDTVMAMATPASDTLPAGEPGTVAGSGPPRRRELTIRWRSPASASKTASRGRAASTSPLP
jgi:hypothetical protein